MTRTLTDTLYLIQRKEGRTWHTINHAPTKQQANAVKNYRKRFGDGPYRVTPMSRVEFNELYPDARA